MSDTIFAPGFEKAQAQYDGREPGHSTDYRCKWCDEAISEEQWDDERACESCVWSYCKECAELCEECEHGVVPMRGDTAIGPREPGCAVCHGPLGDSNGDCCSVQCETEREARKVLP